MQELDGSQPVPMTEEEDEETLAAIDEGIRDADKGRVSTLEEVRERLSRWSASAGIKNTV